MIWSFVALLAISW